MQLPPDIHPAIPFQIRASRASDLLAPPFAGALGTTDLRNRWPCPEELLASCSPPLLTLYTGRRPTLSLALVPTVGSEGPDFITKLVEDGLIALQVFHVFVGHE